MSDAAGIIEIKEIGDPRLEDYRDIRDREVKGAGAVGGLFIAEQALVVERMLGVPGAAKSVLVSPTWLDRIQPLAPPGVAVYVAPLALMKQVAGFDIHRGVLGVGRRDAFQRADLELSRSPKTPVTVLLCEEVSNIDNIGFLFRNAAAFGVDGVLLSPRCHDPLYRKSLRVSIGHALTVPFARSRDWERDLKRLKRDRHLTLIGAATGGDAVDLDSVPRPLRVGLIVGQEYDGLAPATLDLCDHVARIPMAEGVDSLNVAVAAAVCLHRFTTGRRV